MNLDKEEQSRLKQLEAKQRAEISKKKTGKYNIKLTKPKASSLKK